MALEVERVRFVARSLAKMKPAEWVKLEGTEKKNWIAMSRRALLADQRFHDRKASAAVSEDSED